MKYIVIGPELTPARYTQWTAGAAYPHCMVSAGRVCGTYLPLAQCVAFSMRSVTIFFGICGRQFEKFSAVSRYSVGDWLLIGQRNDFIG